MKKFCYCELSSEFHFIVDGKCCEICTEINQKDATDENISNAFKFLEAQRQPAWHLIEIYPPPAKQLLMVTGLSGYVTHRQFLALAYHDPDFRPPVTNEEIRWLDVCNDSLSDKGWHPTHWARSIGLPELQK